MVSISPVLAPRGKECGNVWGDNALSSEAFPCLLVGEGGLVAGVAVEELRPRILVAPDVGGGSRGQLAGACFPWAWGVGNVVGTERGA